MGELEDCVQSDAGLGESTEVSRNIRVQAMKK